MINTLHNVTLLIESLNKKSICYTKYILIFLCALGFKID